MELECLAGGGPHRSIAVRVSEAVERQIQLGGDATTGASQPQHHSPVFLLALLTVIPVVLLVAAVKLENLHRLLGEERQLVLQLRRQRFTQVAATGFQQLEFAALGGG